MPSWDHTVPSQQGVSRVDKHSLVLPMSSAGVLPYRKRRQYRKTNQLDDIEGSRPAGTQAIGQRKLDPLDPQYCSLEGTRPRRQPNFFNGEVEYQDTLRRQKIKHIAPPPKWNVMQCRPREVSYTPIETSRSPSSVADLGGTAFALLKQRSAADVAAKKQARASRLLHQQFNSAPPSRGPQDARLCTDDIAGARTWGFEQRHRGRARREGGKNLTHNLDISGTVAKPSDPFAHIRHHNSLANRVWRDGQDWPKEGWGGGYGVQ